MLSINPLYFFNLLYNFILGQFQFSVVTIFMVKALWTVASFILVVLFFIILSKRKALNQLEKAELAEAVQQVGNKADEGRNLAWEKILAYVESANQSDWKLAILEADTLLDAMVLKMGYKGENLGERLKNVEIGDFLTLNDAWEAHKVRNAIAHEAGYELSQRETKRVIKLFENVFKEFGYL